MNSFTISQLQRFSGINVHSIRAWEKRYDALKPDRSEGNTRYYNGNQLRRILNIASLMNLEYKISELCSMSDSSLNDLMFDRLEKSKNQNDNELLISQFVAAALVYDESLFDKVFSRAVINYQLEDAYVKVLYPALQRLGIMWSADRIGPAQEHFITNLIKQKLNSSIDMLPLNYDSKHNWLLFLPEYEFHETGLLMSNYIIRHSRHRSTYLGANVPIESLEEAVGYLKPNYLLFFLVSNNDEKNDKLLIQTLLKRFRNIKLFVAGESNRLKKFKKRENLITLCSVYELKNAINNV